MEPIRIYDKAGHCLSFHKDRGLLLPMMPLETLKNVPNLDLRPDDVILVTYPKSGTHWFWEILSMLRNGRAETIQKPKQQAMLELMTQQDVDAFPEPRVFNTHFQYRLLPASVREKGNKIVLVHRNPKDVAVSFYNHHSTLKSLYGDYKGTFQDYLPIFTDGNVDWNSWFDYVLEWETVVESGPPNAILVLFYEDMQKEPLKETRRLAEFLEVEATDAFLQDVVKTCSFETMKKDKRPFSFDDYGHGVFYRKGTVGDWKNWFTVAQSEDFDRLFREKMAMSKLQFKFE